MISPLLTSPGFQKATGAPAGSHNLIAVDGWQVAAAPRLDFRISKKLRGCFSKSKVDYINVSSYVFIYTPGLGLQWTEYTPERINIHTEEQRKGDWKYLKWSHGSEIREYSSGHSAPDNKIHRVIVSRVLLRSQMFAAAGTENC